MQFSEITNFSHSNFSNHKTHELNSGLNRTALFLSSGCTIQNTLNSKAKTHLRTPSQNCNKTVEADSLLVK